MPHVIVKLWPGQSEANKRKLTDEIVESTTRLLGYDPASVSVGFEEIDAADWMPQVYENDIAQRWDSLTKPPGYGPGPRP